MQFVHWEKKYSVGSILVDAEHRMLLFLCRKLDFALKSDHSETALRAIVHELNVFSSCTMALNAVSEWSLLRAKSNLRHRNSNIRCSASTKILPTEYFFSQCTNCMDLSDSNGASHY